MSNWKTAYMDCRRLLWHAAMSNGGSISIHGEAIDNFPGDKKIDLIISHDEKTNGMTVQAGLKKG